MVAPVKVEPGPVSPQFGVPSEFRVFALGNITQMERGAITYTHALSIYNTQGGRAITPDPASGSLMIYDGVYF